MLLEPGGGGGGGGARWVRTGALWGIASGSHNTSIYRHPTCHCGDSYAHKIKNVGRANVVVISCEIHQTWLEAPLASTHMLAVDPASWVEHGGRQLGVHDGGDWVDHNLALADILTPIR